MAAMSGIPWVGGLIGATAALSAEQGQSQVNELQQQWLKLHTEKLGLLESELEHIVAAVEKEGELALERLESDEYHGLARRGFQIWDTAITDDKRHAVRRILTNAAVTRIVSDDLVRLFLSWVESYDETHFKVVAALRRAPGQTRSSLWESIDGRIVREDSAEADLFKMLIRDLAMGGVIRQTREKTPDGEFIKQSTRGPRKPASRLVVSAFEDGKEYELTDLGHRFVGYAMNEPTMALPGEKNQ